MRHLLRICLLLALGGGAGCDGPQPEPAGTEAAPEATGVIRLAPEVRSAMGLETRPVTRRTLPVALDALGDVTTRLEGEAVVHAPLEGVLADVRASVGDRVAAGATLAVIRSVELGRAQAAYLKSLGESRLADQEHARQARLFADSLASRRELDEATQRREAARVALREDLEALRVYGLEASAIEALGARGQVDPLYRLRSPAAGTITRRRALRGARVAPGDAEPLFALADMSVVRVDTDIPERSWHAVRVGQPARIRVDAFSSDPLPGKVVRVFPILDPGTHTGKAAIDVPNPGGALRPGMSARVHLVTATRQVLAVPLAALQQEGERQFVFVALPDGTFRETEVRAGVRAGDWVPVLEGLTSGDAVVTKGAFDLLSEAHKASFGGE